MSLPRRLARAILQLIGLFTVIGLLITLIALPVLPRILQVEDKISKADYIVPLAGDRHRYFKAAELFKGGYAPKVLLSNSFVRPPTRYDAALDEMGIDIPPPHELRRRLLVHLGVPEQAMESFGDGHISTVEEAEALRAFLSNKPEGMPERIILVTSPYHTRRAKTVLSDVMPNVQFMVTALPERRLKSQWWRDRDSAITSVLETFKFLHYLLGGRFRSVITSR